jgi:pSer/pThr/pTyr-binding forkhead associated (FHA) protein
VLAGQERPNLQRLDPWGVPVEALPIGDRLTIGRAPDNRLALLDDELASRTHAVVTRDDGAFVLSDLDSTNGTTLWRDEQWRPVTRESLQDADLIVIGAHVFRFSTGDESRRKEDGEAAHREPGG